MPVDFTGLLIARAVWIVGTIMVFRQLRPRPGHETSWVSALGRTLGASTALFAFGYFFVWFYDRIMVGPWRPGR